MQLSTNTQPVEPGDRDERLIQIPQGSHFNPELARELLLLVQEAHHEFDRSQRDHDWDWDTDRSPITVRGKTYNIKLRFGFAEEFFQPREILNTDVRDLGNAGRNRVPFGFIAHDDDSNNLYIVFRGTMTPAEWITNIQFKPGSDPFLNRKELGKVHRGFYKIYSRADRGENPFSHQDDKPAMKDAIEAAINGNAAGGSTSAEAPTTCSQTSQVYVTGHSLGGALATLATLHIKELRYFNQKPILYAFANPRAGGLEFFQQFHDLECYRIANSEDIVPTLPLASVEFTSASEDTSSLSLKKTQLAHLSALLADLDYHHIGEPIYFTLHKGSIADNHIIPIYKEALAIHDAE
ncbi:MAG: lipase family protein [Cyanobacteriota bacterium]|nr:lipase family protein [Cyanobacteriota bacterium]